MAVFVCSQLLCGGLAVRIVAVWSLYDVALARTACSSSGKKRTIPCDALFYNQPHVTSRRAVIGPFGLLRVCPLRNLNGCPKTSCPLAQNVKW